MAIKSSGFGIGLGWVREREENRRPPGHDSGSHNLVNSGALTRGENSKGGKNWFEQGGSERRVREMLSSVWDILV